MPSGALRLFLDSNVLTGGIVSSWGLDKAVLSLCAARICRMVLAQVVMEEVEQNLLLQTSSFSQGEAEQLLDDYDHLIRLARPIIIPAPTLQEVSASRRLITHAADVPVLLSAIKAEPDWLLTHNTKHFSQTVARKTGIRISTPSGFFKTLGQEMKQE
jgi:predicted nucleic acid-binding protein